MYRLGGGVTAPPVSLLPAFAQLGSVLTAPEAAGTCRQLVCFGSTRSTEMQHLILKYTLGAMDSTSQVV